LIARRSLLAAGVAALAAACTEPPEPPAPDPLEPLLAGTVALADRYDATIATVPTLAARLTPLRDAHRSHAVDLARMIGKPLPSGTPAPPSPSASADPAGAAAALRTAEQQAQRAAVDACLAAPARRAPLLGSIAACRATHAEVLT
jgi:hypothetical protein